MPRKNNSIKQVAEYLWLNSHKTETEIMRDVWGFQRNRRFPNKKYADLIRRGVAKGVIAREPMIKDGKLTYVYYCPDAIEILATLDQRSDWIRTELSADPH